MPADATGLVIAYSGGVDSTVLLHATAALRADLPWPVRAIHVNHRLHPSSTDWAEHCSRVARGLGIEFERCDVTLTDTARQGVEAAARDARYAALRERLRKGEVLLTAHHADDQAETLLLALMRGTGVRGLAGMPQRRRFGHGCHARPLLAYRRAALTEWASARSLTWIDDPANSSARFSRNFLRADILPRLEARWPHAAEHLQRAALHLAESAELLDELARIDHAHCGLGSALDATRVLALGDARQRNLLRWWLREQGVRAPSAALLSDLRQSFAKAAADRVPHVDIDGVRVFRHRDVLYAERLERLFEIPTAAQWHWREPFDLPPGAGQLRAVSGRGEGLSRERLPPILEVRFRTGGERLQLPGTKVHRTLKNLLQEADVVPWWRERIPLLYAGERLCAVADLWIDAKLQADPDAPSVKIVWENKPRLLACRQSAVGGR
ncbi:MAG TPA: tRNA lysidine(34) synthetase TilS [Steroidobacteraceae bacterium]|nr:tRNA lysidine(34) synthetase TilS [Steroidobacteraceae bacterium]